MRIDGVAAAGELVSFGDLRVRVIRAREIDQFIDVPRLLGRGDAPEPPYWMHLWPGASALARRVAGSPQVRRGTRVIELGCGLALPALVAAMKGAAVVVSDRQRAPLRFACQSAALNDVALDAVQMDWADLAVSRGFDLCLGADIAYDEQAEEHLVKGLRYLLRPGGVAWFGDSVNTYRTSFVERLRVAGLTVEAEQVREDEDGRPVWVRLLEARYAE